MTRIGIIPARYNSSRFPGKPLVEIHGKTMIQRVYERVLQAELDDVIIATDDERIKEHIQSFRGKVVMTSSDHQTGTERCNEVLSAYDADVILNIQGDEPYMLPSDINSLAQLFDDQEVEIGTLVREASSRSEMLDEHTAKVVLDTNWNALYFSRSAIPFNKTGKDDLFYLHIGMYGYRKQVLQDLCRLSPSKLELTESLEQLRWLENGYKIRCGLSESLHHSVDTPEDLERLLEMNFEKDL
ncbi:MAG: 3-deoxy-manno-octulosonate cytidylyltransferase [Bacteroidetes bacterium]|nr:3-deoxy-manno-octulosonate cytidylyltransferase [Bacteroidota bacterium]